MGSGIARDEWVDALKAVALVGVGLINIQMFSYPDAGVGAWTREAFPDTRSIVAQAAITALVAGKFIAIFTMAFGWSMRAQLASGADSLFRARRRLFALAAIGLLHAAFIFVGDVLVCYAIVGFALLRSRDWSEERLARSIRRWLLILFGVVLAIAGALFVLNLYDPQPDKQNYAEYVATFQRGGYREALVARWSLHGYTFPGTVTLGVLVAIPVARIGYLLRRIQEAQGEAAVAGLVQMWMRRLLAPGFLLAAGAFVGLALARSETVMTVFAVLAGYPAGLMLGCVYAGLVTSFLGKARAATWRARLASIGRNSLSIYILQSVVAGFLMEGYGFGLYATLSPPVLAALSLLITAALGAFSLVWSRYFRLGPFERLLRALIGAPRPAVAA